MKLAILILLFIGTCFADIQLENIELIEQLGYDTPSDPNFVKLKQSGSFFPKDDCEKMCKLGCTFYVYRSYTLIIKDALTYPTVYECRIGRGPVRKTLGIKSQYPTKLSMSVMRGDMSVKIKNNVTKSYLTYKDNSLYVLPSDYSDNQMWTVYNNADGTMFLKNVGNGLYLFSNGNDIGYQPYTGEDNQKWKLVSCWFIPLKLQDVNSGLGPWLVFNFEY